MKKLLVTLTLLFFVATGIVLAQETPKNQKYRLNIVKHSADSIVNIDTIFDSKEPLNNFLTNTENSHGKLDSIFKQLNIEITNVDKKMIFISKTQDSIFRNNHSDDEMQGKNQSEFILKDGHVEIIESNGGKVEVIVLESDTVLWNSADNKQLKTFEMTIDEKNDQHEKVIILKKNPSENQSNILFETQTEQIFVYRLKDEKEIKVIIKNVSEKDKIKALKIEKNSELMFKKFNFYPNPNDGKFKLEFYAHEKGTIRIDIFDVSGKLVYNEKIRNFHGNYSNDIDISNQEKGVYFLRITRNNDVLARKIVIE